jgi:hypothetical protein
MQKKLYAVKKDLQSYAFCFKYVFKAAKTPVFVLFVEDLDFEQVFERMVGRTVWHFLGIFIPMSYKYIYH